VNEVNTSKIKLRRQALRLAIPAGLGNLTIPLTAIIDTGIAGNLGDVHAMAAIAFAGTLFDFIFFSFQGIRMSATVETSKDRMASEEVRRITLVVHAVIAFLLGAIVFTFHEPLFLVLIQMSAFDEAQLTVMERYFAIRCAAAPWTFVLFVIHGSMLGSGNAGRSMKLSCLNCFLNFVLSLLFVFTRDDLVESIAFGSAFADVTLCMIFFVKLFSSSVGEASLADLTVQKSLVIRYANVVFDLFCRTVVLNGAMVLFVSNASKYGEVTVAANGVLFHLLAVFSFLVDGFAHAAEVLLSNKKTQAKGSIVVNELLRMLMCFTLVYMLVIYFSSGLIISGLTGDLAVIREASQYLPWLLLSLPASAVAYLMDGVFVGLGLTHLVRNVITALVIFLYLPVFMFASFSWQNHGQWFALLILLCARAISLWSLQMRRLDGLGR
jgi:MATE family multidrug resistance protein